MPTIIAGDFNHGIADSPIWPQFQRGLLPLLVSSMNLRTAEHTGRETGQGLRTGSKRVYRPRFTPCGFPYPESAAAKLSMANAV